MKTLIDDKGRETASDERNQSALVEQGETVSRVLELLDTLPENQQEVVRLKFQNGLSYREISEVTQLSVTNVGYLLHTAIKALRSQMTVNEQGP